MNIHKLLNHNMLYFLPFSMSISISRSLCNDRKTSTHHEPHARWGNLVASYSMRLSYPLSTHSLRNKCEAQWGVVGPPLPPSSWRNRNFASPQGRLEEKPGAWGLSFHQFLASSPLTSQCLGHNPSSESRGSSTVMTENQQPFKIRRPWMLT